MDMEPRRRARGRRWIAALLVCAVWCLSPALAEARTHVAVPQRVEVSLPAGLPLMVRAALHLPGGAGLMDLRAWYVVETGGPFLVFTGAIPRRRVGFLVEFGRVTGRWHFRHAWYFPGMMAPRVLGIGRGGALVVVASALGPGRLRVV
jgi:hypothetical protein